MTIPSITLKDGTIVRYASATMDDGRRRALWKVEYPDGQRYTKAVNEPPDVEESKRLIDEHWAQHGGQT